MGKIHINFVGPIQKIVGKHRIIFEVDNYLSVQQLIDSLIQNYGEQFKNEMSIKIPPDNVPFYQILINGENVINLRDFHTFLNPGDEVFISIPLTGG